MHDLAGGRRVVNRQSDFLDWADTRIVAPLVPVDQSPPPAQHLNLVIALDDGQFVLIIQSMAAVRASALGSAVGHLSDHQDAITRAVDMVFQGVLNVAQIPSVSVKYAAKGSSTKSYRRVSIS